EPRRDAGRPDQQESVRPHRPHQPPPKRPLHGERDPQREPDGWSVVRRQHEAKEEGCRGNRRHADQVTTGRRHGPSLSAFESSRIREYSVPPKPSSAPRIDKDGPTATGRYLVRSEEHTSELQSR